MRPSFGQFAVAGLLALSSACATTAREADPIELDTETVRPVDAPLELRRAALEDVLSKGPGRFFERVEVAPAFIGGKRFVGYTLKSFYGGMTPEPDGVQIGDVVTAINGQPISRPDEFMAVWQAAGKRDSLAITVMRGTDRLTITYRIVGSALPPVPADSGAPGTSGADSGDSAVEPESE
jgi:type II secretory pathway component PulC